MSIVTVTQSEERKIMSIVTDIVSQKKEKVMRIVTNNGEADAKSSGPSVDHLSGTALADGEGAASPPVVGETMTPPDAGGEGDASPSALSGKRRV